MSWKRQLMFYTIHAKQGLKLCVFWHKVCSWLCQVCSWLCWSVLCEVAKCLEIVEKMNRFALLNFKIFWGQCPQTIVGTPRPAYWGGATAHAIRKPHPSVLRRFAPPCLARGLRPLHRPSLCVVDILRYFRPCQKVLKLLLIFCNKNVSVWLSTVQEVLV